MQFRWAIVYVSDVEASVRFYERAFGIGLRFTAPGGEYAELETGDTALGLAANSMAAQNFAPPIRQNDAGLPPAAFEIGFEVEDVAAAYTRAVEAGATPLAEPVDKPWGQTVAYVRDPDGIIVELGSRVAGEASATAASGEEDSRRTDEPSVARWWEDDDGQQIATGDGMVIRREAAKALESYLLPSGILRRRRVYIPGLDPLEAERLIAAIGSGGGDGDAVSPLHMIVGSVVRRVGVAEASEWDRRLREGRPHDSDWEAVWRIAWVAEQGILDLHGGPYAQPPKVLSDTADLLDEVTDSRVASQAADALRARRDQDARRSLGALRKGNDLPRGVQRAVDTAYALLAPELAQV